MTKNKNMSKYTKEERRSIYLKALERAQKEDEKGQNCYLCITIGKEINRNIEGLWSYGVNEINFPELFLFKNEITDLDSHAWLNSDELSTQENNNFRKIVLMLCAEMTS